MLNYTQEELLEKVNKTLIEVAENQSKLESRQQVVTQGFLVSLKNAIEKNKHVTVDNIKREITNEISVKKPKWIEELKVDNSELEKRLQSVIEAIQKQEIVKEVSIKEASWLTKALKRSAEKRTDYSSLLKAILVEVKKEVKYPTKMKVTGNVSITDSVSLKQPKWYNPTNYTSVLSAILNTLKKPLLVKLQTPITLDKDILDVKVKEPIEVKDGVEVVIKDGRGRVVDFDRQFGRIGGAGGSTGGTSGGATEEKQDDIITAINNQGGVAYNTNEIYENGTDTYFCKESKDGDWYIMKIDEYSVFSHATVTNNSTVTSYADARANVLTLTYETFNQAFN